MLLQPAAQIALLALALAGPPDGAAQGNASITTNTPPSPAISLQAIQFGQDCAPTLAGARSFELTELLDDIVRSPGFKLVLDDVFHQLAGLTYDQIRQATNDQDLDELFGQARDPSSRALAHRISAALIAANALMTETMFDAVKSGGQPDLTAALDDQETPVAIRRCIRHSVRGFVALLCLPFLDGDTDSRLALFEHAAIGAEANLRMIAAGSKDTRRAAETLRSLRLEPLDLQAILERQQQVGEARELLTQVQQHIPDFELPPDPGFVETT